MQLLWKVDDIQVTSEPASQEGPAFVGFSHEKTGDEIFFEADGSDGVTDLIDVFVQALNKAKQLKLKEDL